MSKAKYDGVIKSGIILSIMTVLFKMLGFVKQFLIGNFFGANVETDCYNLAENLIGPFCNLIFSAISVTFLTQYLKEKEIGIKDNVNSFVTNVYLTTLIIAIGIVGVLYICSNPIGIILGKNFSYDDQMLVARYIRKLLIVVIVHVFISIGGAILDAEKKFIYSRLLSLFLSISSILFIVFGGNKWGIESLLYGFVVAYILNAIVVVVKSKEYYSLSIPISFKDNRVKLLLRAAIPLMLGNAVVEINNLIDKIIATSAGEGTSTLLTYSAVISIHIVSAVIVSVFGTIYFSHISAKIIKKEKVDTYINKFITSIVAVISIISIIYIYALDYIVQYIYGYGKLTSDDLRQMKLICIAYALGFIPFAMREFYTKTCYGFNDTKKPMYNGILGAIINVVLSMVLVRYCGGIGIAIATTVSYVIVAIAAYYAIKEKAEMHFLRDNASRLSKILLSSFFCILFLIGYNIAVDSSLITCFIGCCITIILYVMILYVLKYPEFVEVIKRRRT